MRLANWSAFAFLATWLSASPVPAFGDDTYRTSQQCTGSLNDECAGNERLGLSCSAIVGGRSCTGYLASAFDGTNLDVTVMVPDAAPPHPLVVSLHGWGGSKDGQGYTAGPFFKAGYAVLRYSARGFGKSWGQVNLADLNVELEDLGSMIGQGAD